MARQERNSVDYFPHTVSHGKKMFYLRSKHKNDGYAIWFMLLEQLGRAEFHYLDLSDEIQIMYLSSEFMVTEETLKDIIDILVKFGDFDADLWNKHRVLFNEKFIYSVSDAYKKRNNDCISKSGLYRRLGILYTDKSNPNKPLDVLDVPGSTQRKEKDIKEEESKKNDGHENLNSDLIDGLVNEFGFSEMKFANQQRKVMELVNVLSFNNQLDHFINQYKNYKEFKRVTGQTVHSFSSLIGTVQGQFLDGAWNCENWEHKLNTVPKKEKDSGQKEKLSKFDQNSNAIAEASQFLSQFNQNN